MGVVQPPFHPIIYLRGFAARQSDIEATTATPYMGFNLGSTKVRQRPSREVVRHVFESPLIRLMKDYGYTDSYRDGTEISGSLPARSLVIHRYYDEADRDFGSGEVPSIESAAEGLSELILALRDQVCGDDRQARDAFRVYLVAHSMGGLIARCLLQNPRVGTNAARECVDKVFTYGTPHNGVDLRGLNVPRLFNRWEPKNFNRRFMRDYLALPEGSARVDSLNGHFPPSKFFCLVGTNHQDYGLARLAVGPMSDGLVTISNATVQGAPRAFVHRSHSGPFGLVNSEEGYQNLVRFLFGDTRLDARLELQALPLPPAVEEAKRAGNQVRVSYYFDCSVSLRGAFDSLLTERRTETASSVFRGYDELFKPERAGLEAPRWPVLFSAFLDSAQVTQGRTLVLSADIRVHTTDYEINGQPHRASRIHGENLFRETVTLRLTPTNPGWNIRYLLSDQRWSDNRGRLAAPAEAADGCSAGIIELSSPKGFRGRLCLLARPWNHSGPDRHHDE